MEYARIFFMYDAFILHFELVCASPGLISQPRPGIPNIRSIVTPHASSHMLGRGDAPTFGITR